MDSKMIKQAKSGKKLSRIDACCSDKVACDLITRYNSFIFLKSQKVYVARRPLPFVAYTSNLAEDETYQQRLNELYDRIKRFRAAESAKG